MSARSLAADDTRLGQILLEMRQLIHPLTQQGEDRIWRPAEKVCGLIDEAEQYLIKNSRPFEVIRADREAARSIIGCLHRLESLPIIEQAFARHRIAHSPPASGVAEELREEVQFALDDMKQLPKDKRLLLEGAGYSRDAFIEFYSKILRALGEQANREEGEGR